MNKSEDKGIVYCNRVRVGNWYESVKLEEHKMNQFLEHMKNGELLLARYRNMCENLNSPTELTQSGQHICFGYKVCLLAPHVPASNPPREDKRGLLLGGRLSGDEIYYTVDLIDGCSLVGLVRLHPTERNTFVISSADYCHRDGEPLKYSQEFILTLSSSLKKKPLHVRYDPVAIPGLFGLYPLYFSEHAVSNTRWRILPKQTPNLTRFEQEGTPVPANTDIVINHVATNTNLGLNVDSWVLGFNGKVCTPLMKTCLDIYGKEMENNIWQLYTPLSELLKEDGAE